MSAGAAENHSTSSRVAPAALRRNVVANFAGKGWAALMSLAFIPIYVRYLGIEAYGLIGFNTSLSAVLSLLDLGLSATMNREMARLADQPSAARSCVRTLETVYWPLGLLILAIIIPASPYLATHWIRSGSLTPDTVRQAIILMGIAIALQWPYSLYEGGLLGLERQVALNAISATLATLRWAGAILALAWIGRTIQVFFAWQIAVNALGTMAVYWWLWRSIQAPTHRVVFDPTILRGVRRFAFGMAGISLVALLLTQMDKLVLSKMLPLRMFGYYALAASISAGTYYLVIPFYLAFFPRLVRLLESGAEAELARLYHKACQAVSVTVIPIVVVLAAFSRQVLWCYTGDRATATVAAPLLTLLIAGYGLNALMNMPYGLQIAGGWTSLAFYQNVASVVVMLPLLLWLTNRAGAVGAAGVWLLVNAGYVVINVPLMHRRLLRREKWRWYWQDVSAPAAAALAVTLAARAVLGSTMPARLELAGWLVCAWLLAAGAAMLVSPLVLSTARNAFARVA